MAKQSLSQEQFSQKAQQVQGMSRVTDTAFVMATNFDRAMEQKQQEKSADRLAQGESKDKGKPEAKSDGKSDAKPDGKSDTKGDSKDSKSETASSNGGGRGPASAGMGGSILDSIAADVTQVAPVPPQITVSNMGISGAPTTDQILSQQTGVNSAPSSATRHLTVNVRWQK
jgi:hypothetical protein